MNAVENNASALVTIMPTAPSGTPEGAEEEGPPDDGVGEPVDEPVFVAGTGVPELPVAADSCAKPTAGGLARKTLYTFLRNVSPTIQAGWPGIGLTFEPAVISKIAPRHCPSLTGPRFRSATLIGHEGPPNDIEIVNWVLHGKEKEPAIFPVRGTEFGTAPQIASTAAVGPPISVVPVSMAAVFVLPMLTFFPFTVTLDIVCSQNELPLAGGVKLWKSMLPWNNVVFVPPSVNTPPGSSVWAFGLLIKRVRKKENSGFVSKLPLMRACQNGTAPEFAMP